MSNKVLSKSERKRRQRQRVASLRKKKQGEAESLDELREYEDGIQLDDEFIDEQEFVEDVEKSFYAMESSGPQTGALTFDQLDQQKAAREKAWKIREETWSVEDLVANIISNPMLEPQEKGTFIKQVGSDFGDRVSSIMDTPTDDMLKETPIEVLEIEALLAKDKRQMGFVEKHAGKLFPKKDFVRKSLSDAIETIMKGGDGAEKALESLPDLRAEAKSLGMERSVEKGGEFGVLIQKDAEGDWRWVGWPSNNFKDRSEDILTESAHLEYVEHWNKERDSQKLPIFTSLHAPGTARENPVDFVGYENGFLVMSGKLTETEASGLLRVQKDHDLGMSHTGWGVRGNPDDPRQITQYRLFEVTDLPVEMADNPFAALSVISKEDVMSEKYDQDQLAYLTKLTGNEDLAKLALSEKTLLKQAELQEAGVEQKGSKGKKAPVVTEQAEGQEGAVLTDEILEKISEALGMEDLSEMITNLQKNSQLIPAMEDIIKKQAVTIEKLNASEDERLEEKSTPKGAGRFAWMKRVRASESNENLVEGEDLETLKKNKPGPDFGDNWLSEATGTEPVLEHN